ncbi:hypothetical protein ACM66B_004824 [Microbotryomycetes sp. NB124-2]
MAKATPGITIKLGSLHALPALPADKLYQHVLSFKETLEDASTFDAWHNALLLTARCYKGIFDGTIVETYGDVDPDVLLAAHSAAERTLMGSLGTLVKSHLTAYDTVPELYKQLVTRYGVTGIARELEIYASYVRQPLTANDADFAWFATAVTANNAAFARLMQLYNNNLKVLDKVVFLDNLPGLLRAKVVRVLATQFSSVVHLPELATLAVHVQAEMDPLTMSVNTASTGASHSHENAPWKTRPCRHCKTVGHRQRDCPTRQHKNVGLTSVATSYTPYHPQVCVAQTTRDFVWDGGSEIQVTNNCNLFLSYQDKPLPDVSFGGHLVPAKGKGTVDFRRPDGTSFLVNNVWFTPSGHVNALTPNQFLGLGYEQGRTNNEGGSFYQPDGTVLLNFVCKPNLLLPVVDAKPERGSCT